MTDLRSGWPRLSHPSGHDGREAELLAISIWPEHPLVVAKPEREELCLDLVTRGRQIWLSPVIVQHDDCAGWFGEDECVDFVPNLWGEVKQSIPLRTVLAASTGMLVVDMK